ncbi:Crp/Fnr family transcriptional regulator [Lentibacillus saliphilus]|uniref:Crp/Fnr family transcriptional regulator n=1 Tax=Lentibacillus saliphilus TaxID=2737028 RepID=UPI001C3021D4|nr:Crp/Fnr family transcriptional regulator [Lentibacillus saliphilus]
MERLLDRLSLSDYAQLLNLSTSKTVKGGECVYQEGDPVHNLYIIKSGRIRIYKQVAPDRTITMCTRGARDVFGELGLLSGEMYYNSACALENSTLLVLKKEQFDEVLKENGQLSLVFAKWLAETEEAGYSKIRDFIAFGAEGAVASIFIRYSNMYGVVTPEGIRITEPIKLRDISEYIGVSRETVSRIVAKWRKEDKVDNASKYFMIKDQAYFEQLLQCHRCHAEHCVL